jgi:hypothetical protein
MTWVLILLVGTWSQPVTLTYESLQACNAARDFAKSDAKAAFCIPAPSKADR